MKEDWRDGLTQNEISKRQTEEESWNDLQETVNREETAWMRENGELSEND